MIRLTDKLVFPDYRFAVPPGIIAYGGDLSPERLKLAYTKGIFPWFSAGEPIFWWFPDPRFVLFPDQLKVSKSMRKVLREGEFTFTRNRAFEKVISECRHTSRKGQNGTWITDEMEAAYIELHKQGWAHSVEVWKNSELVGGLYGIALGDLFCGESMFAKVSNASKAGFIHFVRNSNYKLIDCQVYTSHLASLGAVDIPAREFLKYLPKR